MSIKIQANPDSTLQSLDRSSAEANEPGESLASKVARFGYHFLEPLGGILAAAGSVVLIPIAAPGLPWDARERDAFILSSGLVVGGVLAMVYGKAISESYLSSQCSNLKSTEQCQKSHCIWSGDSCLNPEITSCSEIGDLDACEKHPDCVLVESRRSGGIICIHRGPLRSRLAYQMLLGDLNCEKIEANTCLKMSPLCQWSDKQCLNGLKLRCADYENQDKCVMAIGCYWSNDHDKCESTPYNALADAAEYIKTKSKQAIASAYEWATDPVAISGIAVPFLWYCWHKYNMPSVAAQAIIADNAAPVCGICLQAVVNPDATKFNCRHGAHYCGACIARWFQLSGSCPECRAPGNP